jgi:gliding motility-associated lipoprotein GldH
MKNIIFLSVLATLLFSCKKTYWYEGSQKIKNELWRYNDTVKYSFPIKDTSAIYDLYLQVVHDKDYPFQNVYTRIHTLFPNGKKINQVFSLNLYSPDGACKGKCSGNTCTVQIPLQMGAYFENMGSYHIGIEQFMRSDSWAGIQSIGLKIDKMPAQGAIKKKK